MQNVGLFECNCNCIGVSAGAHSWHRLLLVRFGIVQVKSNQADSDVMFSMSCEFTHCLIGTVVDATQRRFIYFIMFCIIIRIDHNWNNVSLTLSLCVSASSSWSSLLLVGLHAIGELIKIFILRLFSIWSHCYCNWRWCFIQWRWPDHVPDGQHCIWLTWIWWEFQTASRLVSYVIRDSISEHFEI